MHIEKLVEKYQSKGIIVDTNLLLVIFVGLHSPELIPKFKRTEKFATDDFYTLQKMVDLFRKIVVTQSILTEVSNLLGHLSEETGRLCHNVFANCMEKLTEEAFPSRSLVVLPHFSKFGLADAGIIYQAKDKYLVLTDDWRLSQYLEVQGIDSMNFNHVRMMNWIGFIR